MHRHRTAAGAPVCSLPTRRWSTMGLRRVATRSCPALAAALVITLATGAVDAEARRRHVEPADSLGVVRVVDLPPEGRATLAAIRAGGPFASKRDGIVFGNREGQLPRRPRGYYAEYTVPTPGASTRGARRIIAGRGTPGDFRTSTEDYYTGDHYRTFRRIVR